MPPISKKISDALKNRNVISTVLILLVILIVLGLKIGRVLETMELKAFDFLYSVKGNIPASDKIIFVDIDDSTLQKLGKYPLPRNYYALALRTLKFLGAKQVLFDIEFSEKAQLLVDKKLYTAFQQNPGLANRNFLQRLITDPDILTHSEIKRFGNVHLACAFSDTTFIELGVRDVDSHIKKFRENSIILSLKEDDLYYYKKYRDFYHKKSFLRIIPSYFLFQKSAGFSNVEHDQDGSIRSVPLFFVFENKGEQFLVPQMSFNLMLERLQVAKKKIEIIPGQKVILRDAQMADKSKSDMAIPINAQGSMIINWAGDFAAQGDFLHIPFHLFVDYLDLLRERNLRIIALAEVMSKSGIAPLLAEKEQLTRDLLQGPAQPGLLQALAAIERELAKSEPEMLQGLEKLLAELRKSVAGLTAKEAKETNATISEIETVRKDFYKYDNILTQVKKIKGATIFTGLTATSTTDIGSVPVNAKGLYPLVGVHANVANTILQGKFIHRAPLWINLLLIILMPFLIRFFYLKFKALISLLFTLGTLLLMILLIAVSFKTMGLWLDLVSIANAIFFSGVILSSYEFLFQEKQKRYIKSVFGMYLSPQVIEQLTDQGGEIELSGEERELTAFFSDVAGFTSISESLTPSELVNILNQYLTEMSSIIMDHMGTIDKYEGDAIMAFYGAPVMDPKNAYNACFAAILMQRRLRNLRENVWQKEGKPQLRVRMGINSGNMRVGNMGSKQRMDYTIMGDNVNLASRLEGVNKFYKTEIIVSQFTYEKVKNDFLFRELDSVRVVGKAEAIKIYELLDLPETQDSNRQRVLELYYQGKKFYRQKDFVEAKKQFKDALEINPDDGPSLVFLDRCQKFIKDPKSYTSVFSLSSK